MMQTHRDSDAPTPAWVRRMLADAHAREERERAAAASLSQEQLQERARAQLEERAAAMTERGENTMTAGAPGEVPIAECATEGLRLTVVRMPDDELCTRVTLGEAANIEGSGYLVFRGDWRHVDDLLFRARLALRQYRRRVDAGVVQEQAPEPQP